MSNSSKELREMADAVDLAEAVLPWTGPLGWYASLFITGKAKKLRQAAAMLEQQGQPPTAGGESPDADKEKP